MDKEELEKLIKEIIKAEVRHQLDARIPHVIEVAVKQTLSRFKVPEPVPYIW